MFDDRDGLIAKLHEEMNSWTSISLTVRQEILNAERDSREQAFTSVRSSYLETALGQRRLEETLCKKDDVVDRSIYYCDGRRCARVFFTKGKDSKPWKIEINERFANEAEIGGTVRPGPLHYLYVEKVPLADALRKANPFGSGRALDRTCDIYLFPNVKLGVVPQDIVYFFDRETGWPLRVEYYPAGSEKINENMQGNWTVKDFHQSKGGRYFPFKSVTVSFTAGADSKVASTNTDVVESIQFDLPIASSEFWPKTEPGVQLYDTIHKKIMLVPGPDPRETARVEVPPKPTTPPVSWSSYIAPGVIGLGLALLLVAIVLRLRRS